jgi:hypothetical protein
MTARAAHVMDVQLRPAQPTSTSTATATAAKPDLSLGKAAGGTRSVTSTVPASPRPPKEKRRIFTWIAAGTAVTAAAAGSYFGWSARQAESAVDDSEYGSASAHASDATSSARRANVMFAVAGTAAAAGATLFFVEKKF